MCRIGARKEQGRRTAGAGQKLEQGRSRVGTEKEQGRNRIEVRWEKSIHQISPK